MTTRLPIRFIAFAACASLAVCLAGCASLGGTSHALQGYGETDCRTLGWIEARGGPDMHSLARETVLVARLAPDLQGDLLLTPACGAPFTYAVGLPSDRSAAVFFVGSREEAEQLGEPVCQSHFQSVYQPPVALGGGGRVVQLPAGETCLIRRDDSAPRFGT